MCEEEKTTKENPEIQQHMALVVKVVKVCPVIEQRALGPVCEENSKGMPQTSKQKGRRPPKSTCPERPLTNPNAFIILIIKVACFAFQQRSGRPLMNQIIVQEGLERSHGSCPSLM
jgi:hypothetical protein